MHNKEIWIKFSEDANDSYKKLQVKVLEEKRNNIKNSFNVQLLKAIDREKFNLKIDPQHGIHIPRKNIPNTLGKKYGTDRLWKIDLVGYWRMIYTLTGDDVKIIAFILEFVNHKKYDKLFKYKKK